MNSLLLAITAILPLSPVRTTHVDLVEHHTRCDDEGKEFLRQWIFYDWHPHDGRYHVVAWLADNGQVQREGDTYIFHRWGVLYRVSAGHHRQSITQNDPEQMDQATWPVEKRRGLWR